MSKMFHHVVLLLAIVASGSAHDWETGNCPKTAVPMEDFDILRFQGGWFVKEKTDTGSTCLKNEYYQQKGNWHLLETRDWFVLDTLGVDSNIGHDATIVFSDRDAARMRAKFQLNIAGEMDHVILETDYENYAIVYECQDILNFFVFRAHRRSGSILVRDNSWNDESVLSRGRAMLRQLGIKLDKVSHQGCENPTFNVRLDEKFVGGINDAFDGAVDSVGEALGTAVKSATDLIDDTIQFSRDALKPPQRDTETPAQVDPDFTPFEEVFRDLQDVEIIVPENGGTETRVVYEAGKPEEKAPKRK